jgi:undecaprenyl diphosphate synthase
MNVFATAFDRGIVALAALGIRLKTTGARNGLSQDMLDAIDHAESATANNNRMGL